MANIFLTRKCNLKCPYCFADEFVNKANEEISIENFKKAYNFIKTEKGERLGLIGGEPTLHPHFDDFLDIILEDKDIERCIVYTNGLELDKHINKITNPKLHFLINCNPPSDLGKMYDKLKSNIKLASENKVDFNLGINLYSDKMDYSFIFELLKIADIHYLRFSTALPNSDKEQTVNALESFAQFKPFLFRFFQDCLEKDIVPYNDCNSIPVCLLDVEDKRLQIKLFQLSQKYNCRDTILTTQGCAPVVDILPDLNAVRCFGLSKYTKVNINEFANFNNLRKYFINTIDLYAKLAFEKEDCQDCKLRMLDKCGLCYTYKLKNMQTLKKYTRERTQHS